MTALAGITPLLDRRIDRRVRLLMLQGWRGDELCRALYARPADRLSWALCATGTVVGTATRSPVLLAALSTTAVVGAVTGRHPIERIYARLGARSGGAALPPARAARRAGDALAAVVLVAMVAAFTIGHTGFGTDLGFTLAVVASVYWFKGFCLSSAIFTTLFGADRAAAPTLPAAFRRR